MYKYTSIPTSMETPYQRMMKSPYSILMEEGGLLKYRDALHKLSRSEKINLASKLILTCPAGKFADLDMKIAVLYSEAPQSFYSKVRGGLAVRAAIMQILDTEVKEPHQLICNSAAYPDLFNEFRQLSQELVDRRPVEFASALANKTPSDKLDELAQRVQLVFSQTMFAAQLNEALVLRHSLNQLNSTQAYCVFTNGEFNSNSFKKFQELATCHLADPQNIANNLAQTPKKYISYITCGLDELEAVFSYAEDCDLKKNIDQLKTCFFQSLDQNQGFQKEEAPRLSQAESFFSRQINSNNASYQETMNHRP